MIKRWVYIILTLLLVIGNTSVYAIAEQDIPVFEDMPQDWSTNALENAIRNGL